MSPYSHMSDKIYFYLSDTFGEEAAKNYRDFVEEEPSKYIRVNERKIKREKLANHLLETYGIKTEPIIYPTNALKVIDGYEYVVVQGLRGDVTIIQSRKISQNSIGGKSVELPKSCECKGGL